MVQPPRAPANILTPCALSEQILILHPPHHPPSKNEYQTIGGYTVQPSATMEATPFLQECVPRPPSTTPIILSSFMLSFTNFMNNSK